MKIADNRLTLLNCSDSMMYLAMVIVYSGVTNKDVEFFPLRMGKNHL